VPSGLNLAVKTSPACPVSSMVGASSPDVRAGPPCRVHSRIRLTTSVDFQNLRGNPGPLTCLKLAELRLFPIFYAKSRAPTRHPGLFSADNLAAYVCRCQTHSEVNRIVLHRVFCLFQLSSACGGFEAVLHGGLGMVDRVSLKGCFGAQPGQSPAKHLGCNVNRLGAIDPLAMSPYSASSALRVCPFKYIPPSLSLSDPPPPAHCLANKKARLPHCGWLNPQSPRS